MLRWEDIRDGLAAGREPAVLAAEDQLRAAVADHECTELDQFEEELDEGA